MSVVDIDLLDRPLTPEALEHVLHHGTLEEVRSAHRVLIDRKLAVQRRLSESKAAMLERRQELQRGGLTPRAAQMRATDETLDSGWRRSAIEALRWIDSQVAFLKERIRTLAAAENDQRTRTIRVLSLPTESASDLADALNDAAADGYACDGLTWTGSTMLVVLSRVRTEVGS